ncbi:MAG: HAMP domain-containing histidine kinase [Bacteroidia bacterium]
MRLRNKIIIGGIVVTLLCLILVQAFLINKEYKRSEQRFDQNVHIALQNVRNSNLSGNLNEVFETYIDSSMEDVESSVTVRLMTSDSDEPIQETQMDKHVEVHRIIGNTEEDVVHRKWQSKASADSSDQWIHDILSNQIQTPLHERLEAINLDSSLRHHLDRLGLDNDFLYQISGDDSLFHATEFRAAKIYDIELFPLELKGGALLELQILDRKSSILQSLLVPLSLSFLVLLLSAVLFIYLFGLYRAQKKVAEARDDFINSMSHELKTPIATIQLALENLKTDNKTNYLDIISDENARMSSYIENILQMAGMDKQTFQLNKKQVNLKLLIHDALERLAIQISERQAQITSNVKELSINADPTHLENVVVNIIDNALKYCDNTPEIQIDLWETDAEIKLAIKDNGVGISSEDAKQIFQPFHRVQRDNIYTTKGTGVGLNYAQKIIEAHGGIISVDSKAQQGSTFNISLPK